MKTATHGNGNGLNDLYILPDSPAESAKITDYLTTHGFRWQWSTSDIMDQEWYGKQFIEIPFGEGFQNNIRRWVKAEESVSTQTGLRKQLMYAKSVLVRELHKKFSQNKIDHENRRMVSDCGEYILQWINRSTDVGVVECHQK